MHRTLLLAFLLLYAVTTWALKPSREWVATPDSLGLKYQTVALTTPDHAQLAGWWWSLPLTCRTNILPW